MSKNRMSKNGVNKNFCFFDLRNHYEWTKLSDKLILRMEVHNGNIFMQDVVPWHSFTVTTKFLAQNKVKVLEWPEDILPICKSFQCMGLFLPNQKKGFLLICSKRPEIFQICSSRAVCIVIDTSLIEIEIF